MDYLALSSRVRPSGAACFVAEFAKKTTRFLADERRKDRVGLRIMV